MTLPVRWPHESIWQTLEPMLPGFTAEVLPEIDSTNSELMRRARTGQRSPVLLVAERQTAGRGRLGKQWVSDTRESVAPASLTFSLGLMLSPACWLGLSLAVGLSVAQSLHPDIVLKWPNDLWWRDKKLAGILIETAHLGDTGLGNYVVIGVGINLRAPVAAGLATPPVGLVDLLPGIGAGQVLERIAAPLVRAVQRFEAQGFAPFQSDFNARDALRQVPVTLSDGVQGVAQGVDANGALRVATSAGVQHLTSTEVSLRRLATPVYDHF